MRWWFSGVVLSALSVGCGEAGPAATAHDDVLVLELGGGHARLTEALDDVRARLNAVADGDPGEVAMPVSASKTAETESVAVAIPSSLPEAEPASPVLPPPAAQPRRVRLEQGQTLYRLAVMHLGDGSRWRELLKPNGWTEGDLDRLPAGTWVQLP